MLTAREIIERLQLVPLTIEGGYFRETYRSPLTLPAAALPGEYGGDRNVSTAIYYLLTPETFSAIHRVKSDEVFHFYAGDAVEMLQLWPDGTGRTVTISNDLAAGTSRRSSCRPACGRAAGSSAAASGLLWAAPSRPASTTPISCWQSANRT